MNSDDFFKRMQDKSDKQHERMLDQQFQQRLQDKEQSFQAQQTDRFIQAYEATNKRLEEINTSLREQLEQAKLEAAGAKKNSKWATGVSIFSVIVAIASVFVTAFT